MKTSRTALILLALLAFAPAVPCTAEAPETPPPATVADFLAALSGTDALPPSPELLSTVCTSHAECPTGQLCCYPCGIDGCNFVCMTPVRGRCPFFP